MWGSRVFGSLWMCQSYQQEHGRGFHQSQKSKTAGEAQFLHPSVDFQYGKVWPLAIIWWKVSNRRFYPAITSSSDAQLWMAKLFNHFINFLGCGEAWRSGLAVVFNIVILVIIALWTLQWGYNPQCVYMLKCRMQNLCPLVHPHHCNK